MCPDDEQLPLSSTSLERLLKLNVFEELDLCSVPKECALLPFSAKVDYLNYSLNATDVRPEDFAALKIFAKGINLTINGGTAHCQGVFIAFLNRIAQLGHLESLICSIYMDEKQQGELVDLPEFAEAFIRVVQGNPNLPQLDVGEMDLPFQWATHLPAIFKLPKTTRL
jgi:hypothetical protein